MFALFCDDGRIEGDGHRHRIGQANAIFREELDSARRDGFTADELTKAKSGLLTSRRQNRAQDGFVANSWTDRLHKNETFAKSAELDAKIQATSLEQVNSAFKKYIDPAKLTIVKAGDFAKANK